jgi:hypothetical protein
MIVFGNAENLVHLRNSRAWLCDGTFYSAPSNFLQVYVIFCSIFGKSFPVLYILLKDKSQQSYERMFEKIKSFCDYKCPETIVMDFESAPIAAFRKFFPSVVIYNCLFHYGQIVYRKLRSLGLASLYNSDLNFRFSVKLILSIVFLPRHRQESTYYMIINKVDFSQFGEEKRNLFEFLYNKYLKALFNSDEYNGISSYIRIINNIPLTTNCCEGWNRSFNNNFNTPNPSLSKFLCNLKTIEASVELKINELLACRNRTSSIVDSKLVNIKNILENEQDYYEVLLVKAIALNYNWSFE